MTSRTAFPIRLIFSGVKGSLRSRLSEMPASFEIQVETSNKTLLRGLFAATPGESLYLWSDLSEPFFSHCRWFASVGRGRAQGVVLLYSGLSDPSLQSAGSPMAVAAVLNSAAPLLPAEAWFKAPESHAESWRRFYHLEDEERLLSMLLPPETQLNTKGAQVLDGDMNLEELLEVYADYPGHFFEPSGMKDNIYAVVREHGRVVSIAGTHTYSPEQGVAALGNVVTRRDSRGRGFARRAVAAVAAEARRRGCRVIGLHVAEDNRAAIQCYSRMGFSTAARLVQAWARRRD